jgi:hypothetical protein
MRAPRAVRIEPDEASLRAPLRHRRKQTCVAVTGLDHHQSRGNHAQEALVQLGSTVDKMPLQSSRSAAARPSSAGVALRLLGADHPRFQVTSFTMLDEHDAAVRRYVCVLPAAGHIRPHRNHYAAVADDHDVI